MSDLPSRHFDAVPIVTVDALDRSIIASSRIRKGRSVLQEMGIEDTMILLTQMLDPGDDSINNPLDPSDPRRIAQEISYDIDPENPIDYMPPEINGHYIQMVLYGILVATAYSLDRQRILDGQTTINDGMAVPGLPAIPPEIKHIIEQALSRTNDEGEYIITLLANNGLLQLQKYNPLLAMRIANKMEFFNENAQTALNTIIGIFFYALYRQTRLNEQTILYSTIGTPIVGIDILEEYIEKKEGYEVANRKAIEVLRINPKHHGPFQRFLFAYNEDNIDPQHRTIFKAILEQYSQDLIAILILADMRYAQVINTGEQFDPSMIYRNLKNFKTEDEQLISDGLDALEQHNPIYYQFLQSILIKISLYNLNEDEIGILADKLSTLAIVVTNFKMKIDPNNEGHR